MDAASTERKCLVTGGAGFIGSHLALRLIERGDHVVIIDNLSTGRRCNLDHLDPQHLTFVQADVSAALGDLDPADFDEIYHLAAAVGVRLVIEQPVHTIETNVLETSAVLSFAAAGLKPLLIASTSEVYGKSTKTPFAEDDDVVYGPTVFSRWSYACSKAIDEYLALAHHRTHRLPVVIARLFNTVGPRQVGQYGMVLPRFVLAALTGRPLEVYGDGRQTRCFCDVRDVVGVLPQLLADPACAGRVFNVGSDVPIRISELAELVVNTLGGDSEIRYLPYDEAFGEGFDDLRDRRPDLSRLRRATGFQPRIPLVQTIRDLADSLASAASSGLERSA
ncbi:MAG: GDP-mannose 4,6-dehydratase [Phycisphaerales bacterium]|nr:MAG: GDP-mannose 4,6-dehydratase [Phycisphaerales bacterium]